MPNDGWPRRAAPTVKSGNFDGLLPRNTYRAYHKHAINYPIHAIYLFWLPHYLGPLKLEQGGEEV